MFLGDGGSSRAELGTPYTLHPVAVGEADRVPDCTITVQAALAQFVGFAGHARQRIEDERRFISFRIDRYPPRRGTRKSFICPEAGA